jgi:hypothetical protein
MKQFRYRAKSSFIEEKYPPEEANLRPTKSELWKKIKIAVTTWAKLRKMSKRGSSWQNDASQAQKDAAEVRVPEVICEPILT